jgi:hypothetical protein
MSNALVPSSACSAIPKNAVHVFRRCTFDGETAPDDSENPEHAGFHRATLLLAALSLLIMDLGWRTFLHTFAEY